MKRQRRALATLLAVSVCGTSVMMGADWAYYFGTTWTRWQATGGTRGHIEDCRTRQCDAGDFQRGNMDSSIGFRIGAERWIWSGTVSRVGAGADVSLALESRPLVGTGVRFSR